VNVSFAQLRNEFRRWDSPFPERGRRAESCGRQHMRRQSPLKTRSSASSRKTLSSDPHSRRTSKSTRPAPMALTRSKTTSGPSVGNIFSKCAAISDRDLKRGSFRNVPQQVSMTFVANRLLVERPNAAVVRLGQRRNSAVSIKGFRAQGNSQRKRPHTPVMESTRFEKPSSTTTAGSMYSLSRPE
jgi:hypothetical protein